MYGGKAGGDTVVDGALEGLCDVLFEVVSTHLGGAGDVFGTRIGVAPRLRTSRLK